MNKKIYAGMIAFGIAASFWACGSGEIMNPSENDKTMKDIAKLPDGEVIAAGPTSELMDGALMARLYGSVCAVRDGIVMPAIKQ